MQRWLILAGLLMLAAGLAWPWLSQLPFGRLPGDIALRGEHGRVYIPLASCLVLSVIVSLLFWLTGR